MRKNIPLIILALVVIGAAAAYFTARKPPGPEPDAGVPVYPGAKVATDSFTERLNARDRARLVKAITRQTGDSSEKVISFYKQTLKGNFQIIERKVAGAPAAILRVDVNGRQKVIMITPNEDTGQTEILVGDVDQLKNSDIPIPRH
jgi:hypothetical protein